MRGSRCPVRFLLGQPFDHRAPGEELVECQRSIDSCEPRLVSEQPADRNTALALLTELRPVVRYGCVQIEQAPVGEHVRDHCHESFRRREDRLQRVAPVGPPIPRADHSPGQVDDGTAALIDAHRGADLAVFGEVPDERLAHQLEARLDEALDERACSQHHVDLLLRACAVVRRGRGTRPLPHDELPRGGRLVSFADFCPAALDGGSRPSRAGLLSINTVGGTGRPPRRCRDG